MDNDDDFTFCSVAPPVDAIEAEKVSDDINTIHIDDGNGNAMDSSSSNKNSGSIWTVNASTEKQETVGSLSFRLIDASSRKEVNQQPKVEAQENGGSSTKASPEQKKAPSRKSTACGKVPFEKGYSPMDWLKLTRTHPDLAGLKGQSNKRLITLNEVKQHQSGDSIWTVLEGRVYNIAPYLKFHPGGVDILMKAVGKDCTSLFNILFFAFSKHFISFYFYLVVGFLILYTDKYHAWVNEEFLLEKCLVGILDGSQ